MITIKHFAMTPDPRPLCIHCGAPIILVKHSNGWIHDWCAKSARADEKKVH